MKAILVATDFSTSAEKAVHYAAQLATSLGASLHILHVYHIPTTVSEVPVVPNMDEIENECYEKLVKLGAELQERYNIIPHVKATMGFAVEEIQEYKKEIHAGLIVMGMHERGRFSEMILGSTSTVLFRNVDIPVLIVPEECMFKKPEWIALATDLKETNLETFEIIKEIAQKFNSKIQIVNVLKKELVPDYEKSVSGIQLDNYLEEFSHMFFFPENSEIREGIEDFLAQHPTDIIAMVPRQHGLFERIFGKSVTKDMAFHTHIPLLILPEKKTDQDTKS
jgi:nucleotide-binding universal stress UspA family protein